MFYALVTLAKQTENRATYTNSSFIVSKKSEENIEALPKSTNFID